MVLADGPALARAMLTRVARHLEARVRGVRGIRSPLPDFLLLGAKKAGTTSLQSHLRAHPLIVGPEGKELHHFDQGHRRGLLWYRSRFPTTTELRRVGEAGRYGRRALTFEATPHYLSHPDVPARVARALPRASFVVILRDPVERAWSDHRAHAAKGRDHRTFAQAVGEELEGLGDGTVPPGLTDGAPPPRQIVRLGLYADALDRWFACVDRRRFHIVMSDDLFGDPAETTRSVLRFLGLPDHHLADTTPRNVGSPATATADDLSTQDRLREFYEPHDARLAELLGGSLPWRS